MRAILRAIGFSITLVSAFFVVAVLGDIASGGDGKTSMGVLWGLLVFFSGTAYGGYWLARRNLSSQPVGELPTDFDKEQRILVLAEASGGKVTVPEVAAHCHLSIENSKAALERMVAQGVAELHVTDEGVLVFTFSGFLSPSEKEAARDPLSS